MFEVSRGAQSSERVFEVSRGAQSSERVFEVSRGAQSSERSACSRLAATRSLRSGARVRG